MSARPTMDDQRPPAAQDRWRYITRQEGREEFGHAAMMLGGNSVGLACPSASAKRN